MSKPSAAVTKDIDLKRGMVIVRAGKGDKDRRTVLPEKMRAALIAQMENSKMTFKLDRDKEIAGVFLPGVLERKYPNTGKE